MKALPGVLVVTIFAAQFCVPKLNNTHTLAPPSQDSKQLLIRIVKLDDPEFPLDRLKGLTITLEIIAESAGRSAVWTSTPVEIDHCVGTATISEIPPGRYRLTVPPLRFEDQVSVPDKPPSKWQMRLEVGKSHVSLRAMPDYPTKRRACEFSIHRISIMNPESDLDPLIASVVKPFLEEGKPFEEPILEPPLRPSISSGCFAISSAQIAAYDSRIHCPTMRSISH